MHSCCVLISVCLTIHAVSPEDSVHVTPEVIHAERDTIVEFNCSALGGPANNFTWFRMLDDEVVGSDPVLQVGVEGAFAGGVYECLVENDAGMVRTSLPSRASKASIFVRVPNSANTLSNTGA